MALVSLVCLGLVLLGYVLLRVAQKATVEVSLTRVVWLHWTGGLLAIVGITGLAFVISDILVH